MLSGRGLCDELITRPEESYRLWCVVCDIEKQNLVNEEAKTHWGGGIAPTEKVFDLSKCEKFLCTNISFLEILT